MSEFYKYINAFLPECIPQRFAQNPPYSVVKEPAGNFSLHIELQKV